MSEETKAVVQDTEAEELKDGVVEAEKTEHGFKIKGKWWAFCAYIGMAILGIILILVVCSLTGLFDVIKAVAK